MFVISKSSRQVVVWRQASEKFIPECLAPTFKSGKSSFMICLGCLRQRYNASLGHHASKKTHCGRLHRTGIWRFHWALAEWLGQCWWTYTHGTLCFSPQKQWRQNRAVIKLEWPAQSPDRNPIENVWNISRMLSKSVTGRRISSKWLLHFNKDISRYPPRLYAVK